LLPCNCAEDEEKDLVACGVENPEDGRDRSHDEFWFGETARKEARKEKKDREPVKLMGNVGLVATRG
jgi:hypothetical protein